MAGAVVLGAVYACMANHGAVAPCRQGYPFITLVITPQARCYGSDKGVVIENRMKLCIRRYYCVSSQDCPGTATFVLSRAVEVTLRHLNGMARKLLQSSINVSSIATYGICEGC